MIAQTVLLLADSLVYGAEDATKLNACPFVPDPRIDFGVTGPRLSHVGFRNKLMSAWSQSFQLTVNYDLMLGLVNSNVNQRLLCSAYPNALTSWR